MSGLRCWNRPVPKEKFSLRISLAGKRRESTAPGVIPRLNQEFTQPPQGRQKRESTAFSRWFSISFFILMAASCATADCIPLSEAKNHIGEHRCVSGKVLQVKQGNGGTTFLDFCEDFRVCPFTVVVFRGDLKHVGDVRQLAGSTVEISGDIKDYDGRAEIILREIGQLHGGSAKIPPLPKGYDVEKKGRFSAGKFSHPGKRKPAKRQQTPAMSIEDPADPDNVRE